MSRWRSRGGRVALVVFLLAVVNLPLLHGAWLDHRLDRDGVDTEATVVEERDGLVVLRMPAEVDPDESEFAVRLDADAADGVAEGDRIGVRVLPEDPGTFEAAGQAGRGLLVGLVVFADVVLLGFLLLLLRHRGPAGPLRLVATADVERARPGSLLEELAGGGYVVVGEIAVIDDAGIELDLGDRTVRVDLDGHRNPVGYQQPARVRARLPDSAP